MTDTKPADISYGFIRRDYVLANAEHAEALGLYIARKKTQGKPEVKFARGFRN